MLVALPSKKDVSRLKVAMDYTLRVAICNALKNLPHVALDQFGREVKAIALLMQVLCQVSITVLLDEKDVVFEKIIFKGDNIRVLKLH